eukprot:scaffold48029_cov69-Phaeocystis_antarctica.AAC.7
MRCTSTRLTRPSIAATDQAERGHKQGPIQAMQAPMRAIRKAWHGKARRKNCAAKADSCMGSAKVPVTGCITMLAGSCSLRGALLVRSCSCGPRGSFAASRRGATVI